MNTQTKSEAHNQQPGVNATVTDKASTRLGSTVVDERHATTSGMNCNSQQGGCNPALEQAAFNFQAPRPDEIFPGDNQDRRLYQRLLEGAITNAEMRDQLRLLSYTRRLSDLRERLAPHGMTITKKHLGDGVFQYSLTHGGARA